MEWSGVEWSLFESGSLEIIGSLVHSKINFDSYMKIKGTFRRNKKDDDSII